MDQEQALILEMERSMDQEKAIVEDNKQSIANLDQEEQKLRANFESFSHSEKSNALLDNVNIINVIIYGVACIL